MKEKLHFLSFNALCIFIVCYQFQHLLIIIIIQLLLIQLLNTFFARPVMQDMVKSPEQIQEQLKGISAPCQVLWGKQDKVRASNSFTSVHTHTHNCVITLFWLPVFATPPKTKKVCDVSGARVFKAVKKDAKVFVISNCGHALSVDQPIKCTRLIVSFVSQFHPSQSIHTLSHH